MKLDVKVENGLRKFFVSEGGYTDLDYYLNIFQNGNIKDVIINGNKLIIKYDGLDFIIHNDKAFDRLNDVSDKAFEVLKNKIYTFAKNNGIKQKPDVSKLKPVKRDNNLGKLKVLVSGLGISLMMLGTFGYMQSITNEVVNKDFENSYVHAIELQQPNFEFNFEDKIDVSKIVPVTLNVESKIDSEKLQETEEKYGNVIRFYANRYGIPYDVALAQITQERPNISFGNSNICQIEDSNIGLNFKVEVYDENGFTGQYDEFKVTREMIDTIEGNVMVGMAYDRKCIDRYGSLFTGLFSYNQGFSALNNACDFYNLNINDYLGDEKAMEACALVNKYYHEGLGREHGDSLYLEHVFSYYDFNNRGSDISYYVGGEVKTISVSNTNSYTRG